MLEILFTVQVKAFILSAFLNTQMKNIYVSRYDSKSNVKCIQYDVKHNLVLDDVLVLLDVNSTTCFGHKVRPSSGCI